MSDNRPTSRREIEAQNYCPTCGEILRNVGEIKVDLESNVIILDSKSIALTPNHAVTLHTLIKARPRWVGIGIIMDALYGLESEEPDQKIIGVNIHRIRKQLVGTNYKIETKWGGHFRFIKISVAERKQRKMNKIKKFSKEELEQLKSLGWDFMPTGPNEWDWLKFKNGEVIAQGGDSTWVEDLKSIGVYCLND